MSKRNKKRFVVEEGETIDDCLNRIRQEAYTPVRRVEEPYFKEVKENGEIKIIPAGRQVIFDTIKQ